MPRSIAFLAMIFCSSTFAMGAETAVYGIGNKSCAAWTASERIDDIMFKTWVVGFWSALNVKNDSNHMVGRSTDTDGIVGDVKLYCYQHPSTKVIFATEDVYLHMEYPVPAR